MFTRIGMVALLALGISSVASHAKSKAPQGEEPASVLRFKFREEYKVIVPVSVNGLEPSSFILDTGTKTTMVDESICRQLNLQTIERMPLITFNGTTVVTIGRVESLSMGNASAKGLEVACGEMKKIYPMNSDICGVLGQNFLVRFNYLLDYRKRKIVLDESGDLRKDLDGAELPIEVSGQRAYVLYDSGSAARQPVRFMLDSGTPIPVIFENPRVNSALRIERDPSTIYSPGSVAGRGIEAGRIRAFQIGGATISNLPVRITGIRDSENRLENGLLPTSLFRAIYFNHERGYVILNPRIGGRGGNGQLISTGMGNDDSLCHRKPARSPEMAFWETDDSAHPGIGCLTAHRRTLPPD